MLSSQPVASAGKPAIETTLPAETVVTTLHGLLPAGSSVAVAWEDSVLGSGSSTYPRAKGELRHSALQVLQGLPAGESGDWQLRHAWTADGSNGRIAAIADTPVALDPMQQQAWLGTAKALLASALESARQRLQIEELELSKRLQKALYEIADLAGADLEMGEMLGHFHRVLGTLMYAENCFIVECDDTQSTIRFLYFADTQHAFRPDPERSYSHAEMPGSLTFALLRHGQPLNGPSRALLQLLDTQRDAGAGPESSDWLGVPMWRDGQVRGAVVVQSYEPGARYGDDERALLNFVAEHILTAMDRRQAHVELEQRVLRRTQELQRANRSLQEEIVERRRAESLQAALFNISELAISCQSLEQFYAEVHAVVGRLLDARNFYIALVNATGDGLDFVYSVDEYNRIRTSRAFSGGLTEYTVRRRQPLLASRRDIDALLATGEVSEFGVKSHCWLGVPLFSDDEVVGAIAVQSYSDAVEFTAHDQRLLAFVAHNIGNGLARQRDQNRLRVAHAELEQRVSERTRELGEVNQQLLSQIGERLRAEQRLTHLAMHDVLTGLPNRLHLLDRLEERIQRARFAEGDAFALLFLDLDRFKLVNDSIGHAAGDRMLVEVARRLVGMLGSDDVVARLGGDEFALLVRCSGEAAQMLELGQRLLLGLEESMWVADRELFPSGSIGIALWHPRYSCGDELLRDADAAMYRAKAQRQDRCVIFDSAMREAALSSLELEADLRRAIINRDFLPFYQPIIALEDGRVVGYEALLRWQHERRGLLLPGDFLALGEESGLIEQVDWLLYAQVINHLARGGQGYVSVNVSPRHFRSPDFTSRLFGMIEAAGADPHRLRVEITETVLLDDGPRTLRTLRLLRERGIVVQLDDFGTGFSALSYLHRFPIATLKIDRSFISGLHTNDGQNTRALVEGILSLARTLGIETVGEGVETAQQLQTLQQLGCNYGQGYLLGYPAPRQLHETV
ncbi:EAL domain-containing protein [Stenotrophomonas sp. YIM B06876]|uniref:bifunctional diguanylate cyclase/phosphodiesterase n=1 Tax=Stenotrophomonas sp. YIM B06876 TaxID=3060211 RepID=UPI00273904CB|nr:EAL domain-containing protein [Stenotrophomonas sp. YIM B06876]